MRELERIMGYQGVESDVVLRCYDNVSSGLGREIIIATSRRRMRSFVNR